MRPTLPPFSYANRKVSARSSLERFLLHFALLKKNAKPFDEDAPLGRTAAARNATGQRSTLFDIM
jgi:hypothetical protein